MAGYKAPVEPKLAFALGRALYYAQGRAIISMVDVHRLMPKPAERIAYAAARQGFEQQFAEEIGCSREEAGHCVMMLLDQKQPDDWRLGLRDEADMRALLAWGK